MQLELVAKATLVALLQDVIEASGSVQLRSGELNA
jgi:hypothetical protein